MANTSARDVSKIVINKGVTLLKSEQDNTYKTFGGGYPNVTVLEIGAGCADQYGDDTSALKADLFESDSRTVQISILE